MLRVASSLSLVFVAGSPAIAQKLNIDADVASVCRAEPKVKSFRMSDQPVTESITYTNLGSGLVGMAGLGEKYALAVCGLVVARAPGLKVKETFVTGDADFPVRVGSRLRVQQTLETRKGAPEVIDLMYRVSRVAPSSNPAIPGDLHVVELVGAPPGHELYWSEELSWFLGTDPMRVAYNGAFPSTGDRRSSVASTQTPTTVQASQKHAITIGDIKTTAGLTTAPTSSPALEMLARYDGQTLLRSRDYHLFSIDVSDDRQQAVITWSAQDGPRARLRLKAQPGQSSLFTVESEPVDNPASGYDWSANFDGRLLRVEAKRQGYAFWLFEERAGQLAVKSAVTSGIFRRWSEVYDDNLVALSQRDMAQLGARYGNFLAEQERRERERERDRRENGAAFYSGLNSIAQAYGAAVDQQDLDRQTQETFIATLQPKASPSPRRTEAAAQPVAGSVKIANPSGSAPTRRVTQSEAPGAPVHAASTPASVNTDANRCVSTPELRENDTSQGNTAAYVVNGCSQAIDVRICLKRNGAWNCGVRYGLPVQQRWSWSTFKYSGGVFVDARTSGSDKPLASP